MTATRTVHTADALQWLRDNPLGDDAAILTSLPDAVEFTHRDTERWRTWFLDAAELVLRSTPTRSACVFFQTDVKRDGVWIDKAFLVQQAAAAAGVSLLWHKVVCRAPAGMPTFGRPGYAHLLCFSRELRDAVDAAVADVLPDLGGQVWTRGMGISAAHRAITWLRDRANARTIVAPFCGVGTALAVANGLGMAAVGIERNPARAEQARSLQLA